MPIAKLDQDSLPGNSVPDRVMLEKMNEIIDAVNSSTLVTDRVSTGFSVVGVRDDPESALANLLTALQDMQIITDETDPT